MPVKKVEKKVLVKRVIVNNKKEYHPNQIIDVDEEGFNWDWQHVFKNARKGLVQPVNLEQAKKELEKELAGK